MTLIGVPVQLPELAAFEDDWLDDDPPEDDPLEDDPLDPHAASSIAATTTSSRVDAARLVDGEIGRDLLGLTEYTRPLMFSPPVTRR